MTCRATVFLFCTLFALTSPVIGQVCCDPVGHWGYGATWVTAWYGELALVGSGPKLLVADFRQDAPQSILGEVSLPGTIKAMVVEGDVAYVGLQTAVTAADDLVAAVDLTDFTNPVMVSRFGVAKVFGDLAVQGDVVYATSRSWGLTTVDVSDPSHPIRLANLPVEWYPATIAVNGDFAYIVSGYYIDVVYILDPARPILTDRYHVGEYGRDLVVSSPYLYHLSHDQLTVLDLVIPWSPTPRGDFKTPGDSLGLGVVGETVYLTDRLGEDSMIVIDAADPDSLEQVAIFPTGHPAWDVAANEGVVLLSMDTIGAHLVDVTDSSAPQLAGELPPPAPPGSMVDAAIDRGFVYLADEGLTSGPVPPGGRLRVIDVSQGPPFDEVGRLDLESPGARVTNFGDFVLLTRGDPHNRPLGLDVIDISQPANPTVVGNVTVGGLSWGDIDVEGNHAYITDARLNIIDLSDPADPTIVSNTFGFGGYRYGVSVVGDRAYLAADDSGLCVVDVSDPENPVNLSSTPLGDGTRWLAVRDGLAFMTVEPEEPKPEWEDELRVYDLSDDFAPVEIASVGLWGGADRVSINGDLAFVGVSGRGLLTFDISDPTQPTLVGISPLGVSGFGADGQLYALAGHRGMDVLDTSDCDAPLPQPDFRWTPENPTLGEEVAFFDISAGPPETWNWDFGDGGSSQDQHPIHTFVEPGRNTVTLATGNPNGSASSTATVIVQTIADPMNWSVIVPAAAHIDGHESTEWTSDLVLTSSSPDTDAVLYFMKRGKDNMFRHGRRITLPRGSTAIDDVVSDFFDEGAGSGAIFITSDRTLGVSSKTSTVSSEGSYGQHIPAVDFRYGGSSSNMLIQLTQNDDFRTNLGLVNPFATPLEVTAHLFAADSSPVATATYSVKPFSHLQINGFIEDLSDQPLDDGYVRLLGVPRWTFLAYASVVDNLTGDPSFILPAQVPYDEPLWIPAVAHGPGQNGTVWRTDLEVCSASYADAVFRIELLKSDQANTEPVFETFNLAMNHCARFVDVVQSVFGETATGALRLVPESGLIAASSRTFTRRTDGGTYGQFVGAVPDRDAAVTYSGRLIPQLYQSVDLDTGFRTNIGLLNTSDDTIELTMELRSADEELLHATEIELRPFEHRQLNRPFHGISDQDIENATVVFSSSYSVGGYIAYASVVDNTTGDAVFQPVL